MFESTVESPKRLKLLYDDVQKLYHVITSLTGADGETLRLQSLQQRV
jgi:hypothetical protein